MSISRKAYDRRWMETFGGDAPLEKEELPENFSVMLWINGVQVDADGNPLETLGDPEE